MARYRVGECYLSEQEYNQHINECVAGVIMLAGALLGGFLAYYFCNPEWPKLARFGLIISSSIYFGYKALQYHTVIQGLILLGLLGLAGYWLAWFLWSAL